MANDEKRANLDNRDNLEATLTKGDKVVGVLFDAAQDHVFLSLKDGKGKLTTLLLNMQGEVL